MKKEHFSEKIFLSAVLLSVFLTLLIFCFMFILGLPLLKEGNFFQILKNPWDPDHLIFGIYPMIIGTLAISFTSIIFAFPLSFGCSAFIVVLGPKSLGRFLKKLVQFMTGIPTVIYGFVGVVLLVPIVRELFEYGSGMCILSAGILLSIIVSPTMILLFIDSMDKVPKPYLNAADALGGSKAQKLLYVILPCSRQGILTGVILALGRSMGDTLISLMIAGNAVAVPGSVLDSARTLTAHIALIIAADFDSLEFKTIFACGIVLYLSTTFFALTVRFLGTGYMRKKW
jgi:phosphate transport system permease protein